MLLACYQVKGAGQKNDKEGQKGNEGRGQVDVENPLHNAHGLFRWDDKENLPPDYLVRELGEWFVVANGTVLVEV